ncbi:MAG: hypothetical protein EAZ09_00790 [Oscillatoriales cyanobacterium]|nr:MAG: hypothetical protein EAZ18_24050 [Oscillatoriales cyanobacterium]TAH26389.1 MAG: hypothetical protein EAZ09_00790 [Oscillatoriales cyanobacterium]
MILFKLLPIALVCLNYVIGSDAVAQSAKPGRQIGQAIDCDRDGQQDDIRMDDDGDGIPDRCLLNQFKPIMNQANYAQELKQLQAQPCEKTQKIIKNVSYMVCSTNGGKTIVSASEALVEVGDGVGLWLKGDRVRAIVFFGTGEVVFFNRGVLEAQMSDKRGVTTVFTADERQHFERLEKDGVRSILQKIGR